MVSRKSCVLAYTTNDGLQLADHFSITLDSVKPTGTDESPESLWGEGKPDPKDLLEQNGFLMRKIAFNAAANPGRRGRGPRNRGKKGKKADGGGEAAPAPAAAT